MQPISPSLHSIIRGAGSIVSKITSHPSHSGTSLAPSPEIEEFKRS